MADNPQHRCPECGGTDMRQGFKTQTITYMGLESPPYEQPGLWCQDCGEGLISFRQMDVGDAHLAILKQRYADGERSRSEVKE